MKPLNTIPIEDFLDKARIAVKSNQKSVTLSLKEVTDLQNSLMVVMTRLTGQLDQIVNQNKNESSLQIKMDGGNF